MNEVITDKDKEYEAMEQSSAPGPDQAMSDRVNNRSLRPRSEAFKEFMTTGWDDNEPQIEPLVTGYRHTAFAMAVVPKQMPTASTDAEIDRDSDGHTVPGPLPWKRPGTVRPRVLPRLPSRTRCRHRRHGRTLRRP